MFIKIKVLHEHTGLVGFYFPPGVESTPTFATFCGEKTVGLQVGPCGIFGGGTEPIKNWAQDMLPFNSSKQAVRFEKKFPFRFKSIQRTHIR